MLPLPGRKGAGPPPDVNLIAPERLVLCIGDVHGRFDLLKQLLAQVDSLVERRLDDQQPQPHLVFVGDYVDRGENSAEVLEWLFQLQQQLPGNVFCLMGNHEKMLLEFIDDPAVRGQRWLRNGGLQTMASFGIGGVSETSDAETLTEASNRLVSAMSEGMVTWLRKMPVIYQSGNVCVAHAAMDPQLAPDDQSSQVLIWGHNEFMTTPRQDGIWVVHGHTVIKEPKVHHSRIEIDTGAYYTGRLTAAVIDVGSCEFIQTGTV